MTVYLHQIHTVQANRTVDELFDAVENDYLPLVGALDVRLVGYWQTTALQGRTGEAVAVWELDDYRHLQRFNRALYGPDADGARLRDWRRREHEWVAHTDSLVCEPASTCPTVTDLAAGGVRAAMCTHEIVHCHPYRHIDYPERLAELWSRRFNENPDQPKKRTTVGLYYAKWTNTIAINIWSVGATWDDIVIWDRDWETDPGFELWNTLARELRSDFTDRFIVPAPFSPVC